MAETWKDSGVGPDKSVEKWIRGDRWSKDEGRKSSFCLTDGYLLFEECRIGGKASKIQRSSCTPRRHCERRFWILCSMYRTRIISISNDRQQKSWISYPDCQGAQDKQLTPYLLLPRVNMEDAPKFLKIPNSECPRHLDSSTTTQMVKIMVHCKRPSRSSWTKSVYGHPLSGLLWERQFWENPIEIRLGRFPIGNAYSYTVKKDSSYLCVYDINLSERNKILIRCGKY